MPSDDLIKYYIEQSDKRFSQIDKKLDKLISFRVMLIGAAAGISGLVSVLFQVAMQVVGGK